MPSTTALPPVRTTPPPGPDGAALRGFSRPTVLDGLRALAAVVGSAEALRLWSASALATSAHGQDLAPDQHALLLAHLAGASTSPTVRAAAVSQLTRLRAHVVLARADR